MAAGEDIAALLAEAMQQLNAAGFGPIDYLELCDAETLAPTRNLQRPARLLVAAKLGRTRLIDNVAVIGRGNV
jgi:pantoate--beta-alanine ligase